MCCNTQDPDSPHAALCKRLIAETVGYLERDMLVRDGIAKGAFYAAEDADSEGVEGLFYAWTQAEVVKVLGASEETADFCKAFGVPDTGYFDPWEHRPGPEHPRGRAFCVLHWTESDDAVDTSPWRTHLDKLLTVRSSRPRPLRDTKVLLDWNALAIEGLALAYKATGDDRYRTLAVNAADACVRAFVRGDTLLRRAVDDEVKVNALLADAAYFGNACFALYEITGDAAWASHAIAMGKRVLAQHADRGDANTLRGFFTAPEGTGDLFTREKDLRDGAHPSGNGSAALLFSRLHALSGDAAWHDAAAQTRDAFSAVIAASGPGVPQLGVVHDWLTGPVREIAVIGDPSLPETQAMLALVYRTFLPRVVVAYAPSNEAASAAAAAVPLLAERTTTDGKVTAYVCEGFTCQLPVTTAEALRGLLK
jgi:uncharacterized protein YyaL (SSP411 family)